MTSSLRIFNLSVILFIVMCAGMAHAGEFDRKSFAKVFDGYDGCFMLYNMSTAKLVLEYNPDSRCSQRLPANSTFKIPLSVMAFDQGIITESTVFKWDGKVNADFPDWNRDQTATSWQKYSVVWVSQQLTPRIGIEKIGRYLADFSYGNQDFSGDPGKNNGLTHAWLSSSLKISAVEQLEFLKKMLSYKLPVNPKSIDFTRRQIYQGKLDSGADYFAKTGSGWKGRTDDGNNKGKLRDGWYVGFVENGPERYVFVSNISDKRPDPASKAFGGHISKGIALSILNDYFGK